MSRSSALSSAIVPRRQGCGFWSAQSSLAAIAVCLAASALPVQAENLPNALAKAYFNNPNLNAQRATTRGVDENIPIAHSGYMPHVDATADVGFEYEQFNGSAGATATTSGSSSTGGGTSTGGTSSGTGGSTSGTGTTGGTSAATTTAGSQSGTSVPRGAGITITQTLFDGLRTTNNIRSAESNVFGSRETLRNVEQSVLQSGAQSYMDVLRDTAILDLRASNIKVLDEQLRQTQDRFKVGEVTRTDVAQAEASLAGSRADFFAAQSQLQNSIASFRQVIGEQPTRLEPARPLERGIPTSLDNAIAISQIEHPSIQSALHSTEVAELQVKIAEGALYPTIGLTGSASQRYDLSNVTGSSAFVGSIVGSVSVPIYEGGASYATIRQAKEQLMPGRWASLRPTRRRQTDRCSGSACSNVTTRSPRWRCRHCCPIRPAPGRRHRGRRWRATPISRPSPGSRPISRRATSIRPISPSAPNAASPATRWRSMPASAPPPPRVGGWGHRVGRRARGPLLLARIVLPARRRPADRATDEGHRTPPARP